MTQRTNKHIEKLLKSVDKLWQLNLNEDELLETVFNLILAGKTKETSDVLNFYTSEEWENLLHRIPEIDIKRFSRTWFKMLEESDIEDDLSLCDFTDKELEVEYNRRSLGYKLECDLTTHMQLDDLVFNFLSADFEKRNKILEYGR